MADLVRMRIDERVRLDAARIIALYAELGQPGAERVIACALEDISGHLIALRFALNGDESTQPEVALAEIVRLAAGVGMSLLARVASDLLVSLGRGDRAAQGAILARLLRLGERSLDAVWDLQHSRG